MNVDKIIAYENGELDHDQIVELFQELINSGVVWQLQGSYGRMAERLLRGGHCVSPATYKGTVSYTPEDDAKLE